MSHRDRWVLELETDCFRDVRSGTNADVADQKVRVFETTQPKAAKRDAKGAPEGSKKATILELVRRKAGATLEELVKATGWNANSVRGFISEQLGKKMNLKVESSKREDGERIYRIPS